MNDKIDELTPDQAIKLEEYRQRYFEYATSTITDRPRAEAAARELHNITGLACGETTWVKAPHEGALLRDSLRDSIGGSIGASIEDSLRDSIGDSLRVSIRDSIGASIGASIGDSLRDSLRVSIRDFLRVSIRNFLRVSIRNSIGVSLRDSIGVSLRNFLGVSLGDSIGVSLRNFLRASLGDSLFDVLWDSGWLALSSYAVDVLGVEASDEHRRMLRLYTDLAASAFAIWILPSKIILCAKPVAVDIRDNVLVGVAFEESGAKKEIKRDGTD